MKEKLYDPARFNEKAPAEGMAAVNTHSPEEEPEGEPINKQVKEETQIPNRDKSGLEQNNKQDRD